ncbi:MAG TPA: hypothetical protein VKP00_07245 [Gemmatimonadaceae bacterium]|nr:hypothetical protein [Gemmatimonadaceae bacterium]
MVVASLVVAALLNALHASQLPPTAPDSNVRRTSSAGETMVAPASSAAGVVWYRREPQMDARLMPTVVPTLLPTSTRPLTTDTIPRRRRAVEYSDWYYRRLQLHRWGSWLEFPVFGTEYWLGQKLISRTGESEDWVKSTHGAVAGTLGGLFAINTVTGLWNLYDSRHDTDQRGLVWTHSALMMVADAGFAITGLLANDAEESRGATRHRNVAVFSMSLATVGTLAMWLKRGL